MASPSLYTIEDASKYLNLSRDNFLQILFDEQVISGDKSLARKKNFRLFAYDETLQEYLEVSGIGLTDLLAKAEENVQIGFKYPSPLGTPKPYSNSRSTHYRKVTLFDLKVSQYDLESFTNKRNTRTFEPKNESYTEIVWKGCSYNLTPTQSQVVKHMHKKLMAGITSLKWEDIQRDTGLATRGMTYVFRPEVKNINLLGDLVDKNGHGFYYLNIEH